MTLSRKNVLPIKKVYVTIFRTHQKQPQIFTKLSKNTNVKSRYCLSNVLKTPVSKRENSRENICGNVSF